MVATIHRRSPRLARNGLPGPSHIPILQPSNKQPQASCQMDVDGDIPADVPKLNPPRRHKHLSNRSAAIRNTIKQPLAPGAQRPSQIPRATRSASKAYPLPSTGLTHEETSSRSSAMSPSPAPTAAGPTSKQTLPGSGTAVSLTLPPQHPPFKPKFWVAHAEQRAAPRPESSDKGLGLVYQEMGTDTPAPFKPKFWVAHAEQRAAPRPESPDKGLGLVYQETDTDTLSSSSLSSAPPSLLGGKPRLVWDEEHQTYCLAEKARPGYTGRRHRRPFGVQLKRLHRSEGPSPTRNGRFVARTPPSSSCTACTLSPWLRLWADFCDAVAYDELRARANDLDALYQALWEVYFAHGCPCASADNLRIPAHFLQSLCEGADPREPGEKTDSTLAQQFCLLNKRLMRLADELEIELDE